MKIFLMFLLTTACVFAGLPFSEELKSGDVTIMLGVHRADPLPGSGFVITGNDGVQVMVKTTDPSVTKYNATVRARVNGKVVAKSVKDAVRANNTPYTILVFETGRTDDVLSVTVEEIRSPTVTDFSLD